MNYARIYSEFIADRLTKQPVKPDYFEKHHILPRALGGLNGKENIIRLTPEDHLFAHLILAHIHGGKMWNAVYAMVHLANDSTSYRRKFGNRPMFGKMRREVAAHHSAIFSGPTGPQADKTRYTLHSFDGRVATGNRFELEAETGIPRQQISALLLGVKKSGGGMWYCKKHNPDGLTGGELTSIRIRDYEVLTLFHKDGSVWTGSQWDFFREFGKKLSFQSKHGEVAGWHRTKQDASDYDARLLAKAKAASEARGSISGASNPNADSTMYAFLNATTGETRSMTRTELSLLTGVRHQTVTLLINKDRRDVCGWSLPGAVWKRTQKNTIYTFKNQIGERVTGTRMQIADITGLAKHVVKRMIDKGRAQSDSWMNVVENEKTKVLS